ncbi:MAG: TIGR00296 family protein [Candidatus Anstonellaceae archaeon]
MGEISAEQGAYLVSLARRAIEQYFATGKAIRPERSEGVLGEKRGVFVTLETYPQKELRGCIGYPLPIKELALAVVDNALHAAFEDPRFPPLEKQELGKVAIEVSVLTVPERIVVKDPSEYPKKIKVGRDGLIIEYGYSSGLLLPQVPVEWNWTEEEFLEHICQKAGLPPNMWRSPSAKLSKFQATIFAEQEPGGKVARKKLVK